LQAKYKENTKSLIEVIPFVTVKGSLVPKTIEDRIQLVYLLRKFTEASRIATLMLWRNKRRKEIEKRIYEIIPNVLYVESAIKHAKLVVEGAKVNNAKLPWRRIKHYFLFCRGNKWEKYGNRNIRIVNYKDGLFLIKIKNPFSKDITCTASFGRFTNIILDLLELIRSGVEGYSARIVLRSGKFYIHVNVPIELYLKHTMKHQVREVNNIFVGIDVNAGFIDYCIIENYKPVKFGRIEFREMLCPQYPRGKLWDGVIPSRLGMLIDVFRKYNVSTVFLENLFEITNPKHKVKWSSNPSVNRKISRFPKRKLLERVALYLAKHGFHVYFVNPAYTSKAGMVISKRLGVDKHKGSSYVIAYRGLKVIKNNEKWLKTG